MESIQVLVWYLQANGTRWVLKMGAWQVKELNKVDHPFKLLLWYEYGQDTMTVKKISIENEVTVGVRNEMDRIQKLSEEERKKELANLPYMIESKIAKELGVNGSLPYEIRSWVSSVVTNKRGRQSE